MIATYRKHTRNYEITLNRKEAETLGYAFTTYSNLLTALKLWPDLDEFRIYGSKWEVKYDLERASEIVNRD